jgi:hypothetical protein
MSQGYASVFFNMDSDGHWFAIWILGTSGPGLRFQKSEVFHAYKQQIQDGRLQVKSQDASSPVWTLLIWQDPFGFISS